MPHQTEYAGHTAQEYRYGMQMLGDFCPCAREASLQDMLRHFNARGSLITPIMDNQMEKQMENEMETLGPL